MYHLVSDQDQEKRKKKKKKELTVAFCKFYHPTMRPKLGVGCKGWARKPASSSGPVLRLALARPVFQRE